MQTSRHGLLLFTATLALTLAGCANDDFEEGPTPAPRGRQICFAPSEVAASRATATTSPGQVSHIGVIAHASWYEPLLMANDLYERDASGIFRSKDVKYWVDDPDAKIDFYAFTPYDAEGLTLPTSKTSTTLSYTMPAEADAQQDVMLAVSKGIAGDYNQAVPLSFRHLLAGVRVRYGELPAGWSIRSVTLTGVHRSGTLDFAAENPAWTNTDAADATVTSGNTTTEETLFMLLPQRASESAPVTLTVTANNGKEDITYTSTLTSADWKAGNITTYTVSVYDYKFSLETTTDADAHYVIYRTAIKAESIPAGREWNVTCSTPAGVSIQLQADMNTYAQQGFWTDKLYEGNSSTSARGEASLTLTGPGTFPVAVFIPENTGDTPRDITLSIQVAGKSTPEAPLKISQLCPAWTSSGFGWEQTDDNESAEYGFKWNRVVYYAYLYSATALGNSKYESYCKSIIESNNATSYAEVGMFRNGIGSRRYYIKIDYGKLNNLSAVSGNRNDGLQNTVNLNNRAGSATTGSFEEIVSKILKTESGHETEPAFRLGNGSSGEAPAPTGENINGSPAVGFCLKKNRYNLRRTTSSEGDVSVAPFISDADIVWYMPAVDQFATLPAEVVSPISAGDYWSSTSVNGGTAAYLGSGAQADRLEVHKVRAARNRP